MTTPPPQRPLRQLQVLEYDDDPSCSVNASSSTSRPFCRSYVVTEASASVVSVTKAKATKTSTSSSISTSSSSSAHTTLALALALPVQKILKELFLPIGFPHTVRAGYLEYQLYDSLQGLCSYLRSVVCTASVLQAAGVGNAEATALSAALTWALKDGLGMIGALVFSYAASPLFDSYVKEFRLFADVINDVGLTLDMVAPWFANNSMHLLIVTSAAALCKTLCGISAGATKSSITVHFAVNGNMADLNAKESTQETLVSLMGMVGGVALAKRLTALEKANTTTTTNNKDSSDIAIQLQWLVFWALTAIHVWANWKGVKLLKLETVNRERAEVVLQDVVRVLVANCALQEKTKDGVDAPLLQRSNTAEQEQQALQLQSVLPSIPRPVDINESLLSSARKMLYSPRLVLTARLTDILQHDVGAVDDFCNERYVLTVAPVTGKVLVCLLAGATPADQLQAFVHASLLVKLLDSPGESTGTKLLRRDELDARRRLIAHQQVAKLFPNTSTDGDRDTDKTAPLSLVAELVRKGWQVQERLYLGFPRRRSQWSTLKEE